MNEHSTYFAISHAYRLSSQHSAAVPTTNIAALVAHGFLGPIPSFLRRYENIFQGKTLMFISIKARCHDQRHKYKNQQHHCNC